MAVMNEAEATPVTAESTGQPLVTTADNSKPSAAALPMDDAGEMPPLMVLTRNFRSSYDFGTQAFFSEAVDFYCRAAKKGNAEGYYMLGWFYANGRGVARDLRIAARLYVRASELGHSRAKLLLETFNLDAEAPEMPSCLNPDPPAATMAELQTTETVYEDGPILRLVERLAPRYEIDTALAMAFISVESNFDPRAVSPRNAQGLMQLIPETSQRFRVRDAFNPEDNIRGGLAYLQWLLAYFRGNVELVAAAYNSGEGTVDKYKGIPPYKETQNYVRKILAQYRRTTHPFQKNLTAASPILN